MAPEFLSPLPRYLAPRKKDKGIALAMGIAAALLSTAAGLEGWAALLSGGWTVGAVTHQLYEALGQVG